MSLTEKLKWDSLRGLPNYKFLKEINNGYFGRVYEASEVSTGTHYALKVIEKAKLDYRQHQNVKQEVEVMGKISHPNIVKLKEFVNTQTHYVIVMELMMGGDLFDRLEAQTTFVEEDARQLIRQVAEAIKYLHDNGIAHRDLKIENLLFAKPDTNVLKLGDFGLAKILNGLPAVTRCGTSEYLAPEIVQGISYSSSVDIWALGCLTYIILFGTFPFYPDEDNGGRTLVDVTEKIKTGRFNFPEGQGQVSESAKDLICKSLERDPSKRLTAQQFLDHSWIKYQATTTFPLQTPAALKTVSEMRDFLKAGVMFERDGNSGMTADEVVMEIQTQKQRIKLMDISDSELLGRRKKNHQKKSNGDQKPPTRSSSSSSSISSTSSVSGPQTPVLSADSNPESTNANPLFNSNTIDNGDSNGTNHNSKNDDNSNFNRPITRSKSKSSITDLNNNNNNNNSNSASSASASNSNPQTKSTTKRKHDSNVLSLPYNKANTEAISPSSKDLMPPPTKKLGFNPFDRPMENMDLMLSE